MGWEMMLWERHVIMQCWLLYNEHKLLWGHVGYHGMEPNWVILKWDVLIWGVNWKLWYEEGLLDVLLFDEEAYYEIVG